MQSSYILSWILIIVGAVVTFLSKPLLTKKFDNEESLTKYTYIFKTIGMWLVIIGAVSIFLIGGNFGVGNQ